MNETDELRYVVGIKKPYKIFFVCALIMMLAIAVVNIVLSFLRCTAIEEYIVVLLITCFFLFVSWTGYLSIVKRVEVYKGKVVYHCGWRTEEYKMSDIRKFESRDKSFQWRQGNGQVGSSWDIVTTFYDKNGKKIFKFGLAYKNVDRLKKDVANTQKSISNNKMKKTRGHS